MCHKFKDGVCIFCGKTPKRCFNELAKELLKNAELEKM